MVFRSSLNSMFSKASPVLQCMLPANKAWGGSTFKFVQPELTTEEVKKRDEYNRMSPVDLSERVQLEPHAISADIPMPPVPNQPFDPYARTESMAHRGRYSYASSAVSTINSPRRVRRRKDPTPFK